MLRGLFFCVLGSLAAGTWGCGTPPDIDDGVLRVAVAREPLTWNRLLASDLVTHVVTDQLHAPLIRLNRQTQLMEPALAESWSFSEDGTVVEFKLKQEVRFSDGEPFTAADVRFTFEVLHDPSTASPLVDTARIDGEPLMAEVVDESTVRFRLPRRTATVERIFDSIAILPEHRLSQSLADGAIAAETGIGAKVENIVGLGPFRLFRHVAGQRVIVEKNPYYYRSDEGAFPALDRIVFEIVPDASARLLRLRAGEIDLIENVTTDGFQALSTASDSGVDDEGIVLSDLGPDLLTERLWFNLNPDSPIDDRKRRWFGDVRFRRAVSLAIDRVTMAEVAFGGLASAATGPVSIANHFWRDPEAKPFDYDLDRARTLLSQAGFTWKDDALVDADGEAVRFSVVTTAGNEQRERELAFIQEDLARLGIEVIPAPVEGASLVARITRSFDYEACLLGFTLTDPDPSSEMALWLSQGPLHLWHPAQESPATEWEARIDEIMEAQVRATDPQERKLLYHELQRIVRRELPVIDLLVPHALRAYGRDVRLLRATPLGHVLWNSDEVEVVRRENAPN